MYVNTDPSLAVEVGLPGDKDMIFNLVRRDPRTSNYLLMRNPYSSIAVAMIYIYICVRGKSWMSSRPPFAINHILVIYNVLLVVLNFYIAKEVLLSMIRLKYSVFCEPHIVTYEPDALKMCRAMWMFMVSKYVELLDTAFFLLRKKFSQVSVLHVYHHFSMLIYTWGTVYAGPTGAMCVSVLVNSCVHVIMYTYYTMSAVHCLTRYLCWKRYLTAIQLCQFVILLAQCIYILWAGCGYPRPIVCMMLAFDVSLIALFANFYQRTYLAAAHHHRTNTHNSTGELLHSTNPDVERLSAGGDASGFLENPK